MIPQNVLTFVPLTGGCSEGLDAFRFFFKPSMKYWSTVYIIKYCTTININRFQRTGSRYCFVFYVRVLHELHVQNDVCCSLKLICTCSTSRPRPVGEKWAGEFSPYKVVLGSECRCGSFFLPAVRKSRRLGTSLKKNQNAPCVEFYFSLDGLLFFRLMQFNSRVFLTEWQWLEGL